MKSTRARWIPRMATTALTAVLSVPLSGTPLSGTMAQAQVFPINQVFPGSNRDTSSIYAVSNTYAPPGILMDNRRQTFSGIAQNSAENNQFEMRTDSGRVITVIARQSDQARKVSRGDRITVAGYYRNNNVFDAEDLNFLNDDTDDDGPIDNNRRNLSGYALGSAQNNQFQIRTNRNRVITIIARQSDQARKVNQGDQVTVAGYFRSRNVFDAEDLNINSTDDDYETNRRQTFSGTALEAANGNQFQVRTDRNRVITIIARQTDQARKVNRGDRVTVAGYYRSRNIFDAEDLNINEYVDEGDLDNRQTLRGTALGSATGNRFEMRTGNGRILMVTARQTNQAQKVRRGDRVTVAGYYRGRDNFDAEDLNINSGR